MQKQGIKYYPEIFAEYEGEEVKLANSEETVFVYWGAGETDEYARFSILPKENTRLFGQVYLQLFAQAIDDDFSDAYNLIYRTYLTYNDLPQLYTSAGFKPTGDELNLDGVKFQILSATGKEHIQALLRFSHLYAPEDQEIIDRLNILYEKYTHSCYSVGGKEF